MAPPATVLIQTSGAFVIDYALEMSLYKCYHLPQPHSSAVENQCPAQNSATTTLVKLSPQLKPGN